jgi:hypothetical protein
MPKFQQSISLPPEVWVQVDDLVGYFGESRGEVITHVLNIWFRNHGAEIRDEKLRIDALRPKIDRFREEHADQLNRKRKGKGTPE